MKQLKKLKWLIPLAIISGFPYYFKTVAQSYSWVTSDTSNQAFLGFMTILSIGMFAFFGVSQIGE